MKKELKKQSEDEKPPNPPTLNICVQRMLFMKSGEKVNLFMVCTPCLMLMEISHGMM